MTQPPALITSDVALLEGTGPRAVERIHGELSDIPVIFITGTPQDCHPCAPPGRLLSKPVNPQVVARTFHELLSG